MTKAYRMRVEHPFTDIKTGKQHLMMDIIDVEEEERVRDMITRGLASLDFAPAKISCKKSGPRVIIFQRLLYCIGGIETWDYNLAKIFKDRNIKFVFQSADIDQAFRLSQYCDIEIDDSYKSYNCDVAISANYDGGAAFLDRVSAKKYYQTIHSDFNALKRTVTAWSEFEMDLDPRFDKIIAASQTASDGLMEAFGIDSTVVQNPLAEPDDKPITFITLSRASEEKGIDKVIHLAREFHKRQLPFVWIVAATLDQNIGFVNQLKEIKEVVLVEPSIYAQRLLSVADYLCQFSLTESYCYSMHEALQAGIPVIATKFEEAEKWIKDGKNGYLLEHDLSNFDEKFIDKVFNKKPTGFKHDEPIDKGWFKVMKGEL